VSKASKRDIPGGLNGDRAVPTVLALRRTCIACPSQWEGTLADGQVIYARFRHGYLSVGLGQEIAEAVDNSKPGLALYEDLVGDGLDGFMDFEELKGHLGGLLEFPAGLVVENERQLFPSPEPGGSG
jgi:hypothetical protein